MRPKRVAVFGSTGSIGRASLDVIAHLPDRFKVYALAARSSVRRLCAQAQRFKPERVILTDWNACEQARRILGPGTKVEWGLDPLIQVAGSSRVDILVMAMSGTTGILPVIAALEKGKRVALATKEILVSFGNHVTRLASKTNAEILPIDSELSALHQCLHGRSRKEIRRIILTASGGPFWRKGPPKKATIQQVLRHPTWNMGRKITVDSATLMNKGLEVIETARLLGLAPAQIEAVIHPQSIIHSLVEFQDGSLLAQLSLPDMRLPIQYCLTYPERLASMVKPLRLEQVRTLEFHPVSRKRFPCIGLAYLALENGPAATCVLNAANQVAAEAFLSGQIAFGDIPGIISRTLRKHLCRRTKLVRNPGIKTLMRAERWAIDYTTGLVK